MRLNDDGMSVLPGPLNRKEAEIFCGVLTISMVSVYPTDEDPKAQALWFNEIGYCVPSEGADKV